MPVSEPSHNDASRAIIVTTVYKHVVLLLRIYILYIYQYIYIIFTVELATEVGGIVAVAVAIVVLFQ